MRIFSYILMIALVIPALTSTAQKPTKKKMPTRTDKYIHMPGLRLGMDITRPFQGYWTKGDRYGMEFSADLEMKPNLYGVAETGWEQYKLNQDYVNYQASGNYMRIGIDYNLLQADSKDQKDIFYAGLRYGFALGTQKVNNYITTGYWGDTEGSFSKQTFGAHWLETVVGLKGELLKNFYMGWSIRAKFMIAQTQFDIPSVYFTPGYGAEKGGVAFDFNYSIYYTIPFRFKKAVPKEEK